MSRIGKLPISIPAGVTITLKDNVVTVKGPKGEMSQYVNPAINVTIEDGHVTLTENDKEMLDNPKQKHAFHGLYRSLVHNMVVGVSEGYKKELELVGVGYRASNQGNIIELALGYTHNIFIQLPAEVKVETKSERNKNPLIILESCDKQLLGQVCSKIRSFRKPEPYKGKGCLASIIWSSGFISSILSARICSIFPFLQINALPVSMRSGKMSCPFRMISLFILYCLRFIHLFFISMK